MSEPVIKAAGVYARLFDGRTGPIRPAGPNDFDAVQAMPEEMSPNHAYLRFFSLGRLAAGQEAQRVARSCTPSRRTSRAAAGCRTPPC